MGLDVYVGTLTRYLVGDWELITQQAGRELGLDVRVERADEPEDAIRDPEVVREAVLEWREALAEALGVPLEWPEDDAQPYFTDKPDWSGYGALVLRAAHEEHPDVELPEELPENPFEHPLFEAVTGGRRGLFRRRQPAAETPRYASLYGPEVWLPAETDGVWAAPFVTGHEVQMASTASLAEDLHDLARRLGAGEDDLRAWRGSGGGGEVVETLEIDGQQVEQRSLGGVEELARFALAVFLDLADRAVERRLPVKLDY